MEAESCLAPSPEQACRCSRLWQAPGRRHAQRHLCPWPPGAPGQLVEERGMSATHAPPGARPDSREGAAEAGARMRQAAGEEGPRGPRGPHAAPARVHTGLRSQGERGTHRSVQGGCLTPTPTSHRPEVQRVADDAPVGGTQFPGPSSGRSGGSQCPPPRGWRWLWVPCHRQAGTGLPGTCGALCYALVDGLVLKNHAPAAGGSFPPSPAQPGGCHRRAPQTCPGAEGHPLRVGVPRGGAGGARAGVCVDLRERGHLLWLLFWVSQMSSLGPNGFPFFSRTSQGSGTPWAAQEKMALLPRGLDCGHERKWGELGTEGGGTLPGPAPGSHGG